MTALRCRVEFLKRAGKVALRFPSRLAKANSEVASIYVRREFLSSVRCFASNRNCLPSVIVSPRHSAPWKPSATPHNVFHLGVSWILPCHLQRLSLGYSLPSVDHFGVFRKTLVLHRFLWWQLWKLFFSAFSSQMLEQWLFISPCSWHP